ncbi:hypothetical protein C8J57DRAFT_1508618 [Mycena rebaudengoi]|nr:hypothetical protein C8J57DRAFT_1508618 [Mycena rebaudengoi]
MASSAVPDSRIYSTRCLRCYADPPAFVYSGLGYCLPLIEFYHSREVLSEGRRYLVWSCNSVQDPYYPGPRDTREPLPPVESRSHGRYDGLDGRYDYSKVPQLYDGLRPLAPVHIWVTNSPNAVSGTLRPDFISRLVAANDQVDLDASSLAPKISKVRPGLEVHRPRFPSTAQARALGRITFFEAAVDQVAQCQRAIKEKQAWCEMARENKTAQEGFMGVWINNAEERDCLWFLTQAGVPCFVVHEASNENPAGANIHDGFVAGTEVEPKLNPLNCEFDRLAQQWGATDLDTPPVPRPSGRAKPATSDLPRSCLRWQLKLPVSAVLEQHRSRPLPPPFVPPSAHEASPMRGVVMGDETSEGNWIRPPVIVPPRENVKWTTFVEETLDEPERTVMKQVSKKARIDGSDDMMLWFDRAHHRKLCLEALPPIQGYLSDVLHFGRPAPAWDYVVDSNGKIVKLPPSEWMYMHERPDAAYIGRRASSPIRDEQIRPGDRRSPPGSPRVRRDSDSVSIGSTETSNGGTPPPGSSVQPPIVEREPPTEPNSDHRREPNASLRRPLSPGKVDPFLHHHRLTFLVPHRTDIRGLNRFWDGPGLQRARSSDGKSNK